MKQQDDPLPQARSIEQFSRLGPEKAVSAIAVGYRGDDLTFLGELFDCAHWFLDQVSTLEEALILLKRKPVDVAIANKDLCEGCWRVLLDATTTLAAAPPLIVTSRFADERLWLEVLSEGGYDVLAQPFEAEEAIRVIGAAARRGHNARAQRASSLRAGA
jgi:DNA-binding response OmpR family regulator